MTVAIGVAVYLYLLGVLMIALWAFHETEDKQRRYWAIIVVPLLWPMALLPIFLWAAFKARR